MRRFHYLTTNNISKIPKTPGVYAFKDKNEVIYIGKAARLRSRVQNHFRQPSYRDNLFMGQVTKVGCIETNSEIEALLLESQLIKQRTPKYNVMWKDDKNYFFVAITKEDIPRVLITHQPRDTNTTYIGPFVEGKPLRRTLRMLRRVFPYRTSKTHPKRQCQYCNLGLCPGGEPEMNSYKKEIQHLSAILQGKRTRVLSSLKTEMRRVAKNQEFEKAARLRDQIEDLATIIEHAKVLTPSHTRTPLDWKETPKALQKVFKTKTTISRIEAYDISNIQGKEATGSLVVFKQGRPAKDQYRKFKIHISGTPNDTAMIQELVSRRLKHTEWNYPDIMIIDGGKGQLSAALKAMTKSQKTKIKVGALAKRNNELFLPNIKNPILLKNVPESVSNCILHIRDEAHRFAITYHRKLRKVDLLFQ